MPKRDKKKFTKDTLASFIARTSLKSLRPLEQIKFLLRNLFSIRITRLILLAVVVIVTAPIILFVILRPTPATEINYGVTFSRKYAQEIGLNWQDAYIKTLDELGVKNIRLVAYWDDAEKERGKYDFSDVEWQLNEADKRNVSVIMAIGHKVPRYPECFEPTWWKNLTSQHERDEALYDYVKMAVQNLKKHNSIKMWEVENEPFFPFGTCIKPEIEVVKKEITIVREIDQRPILIQDSGEGGFWLPSYQMGDYLGISMYRKIWYNFWGVLLGKFIYFQYPLAHWSYKIKADLFGVPYKKIFVTELQAEPWGPVITTQLTQEEKDKTMSKHIFIDTLNYAQKSGFKDLYFWGVEWWLWEKEVNNNPFFWETAKAVIKS